MDDKSWKFLFYRNTSSGTNRDPVFGARMRTVTPS